MVGLDARMVVTNSAAENERDCDVQIRVEPMPRWWCCSGSRFLQELAVARSVRTFSAMVVNEG